MRLGNEEDQKRMENWKPSCSSLHPDCGYGPKLDKTTCGYCDGTCGRPGLERAPVIEIEIIG